MTPRSSWPLRFLAKAAARCWQLARWGSRRREAGVLGVLLNTRGLIELVVLNIGLELGILSPVVFSMLVLMALITTLMTSPLITWLRSAGLRWLKSLMLPNAIRLLTFCVLSQRRCLCHKDAGLTD